MLTPQPAIAERPKPWSLADQRRWDHSSLRNDMLVGQWEHHLQMALGVHVSPTRRRAWGLPDFSSCLYGSIVNQLGGPLYDDPPKVTTTEEFNARLDQAELWPLMQDYAVSLVGLREMAMRIEYDTEHKSLAFRPVLPFDLIIKGHRHQRHQAV